MKWPSIVAAAGLTSTVSACLLDREIELEREYAETGVRRSTIPKLVNRQETTTYPIGTGDRFSGGCVAPVGLGMGERDLESVMNVKEVTSAVKGLARKYPDDVELLTIPFTTYENRTLPAAVIGGANPRVFIMSGIHARERGGPDNVLYFVGDLLAAKKAGTGLTYGENVYSAEDVETALSAGVVIVPITNPDGVQYDQTTDSCWRKNRNPTSSVDDPSGRDVGIDLNRNYDFIWDYQKHFHPSTSPASNDPRSEVFYGTAPESEPETKAIVWALDQYKNITWMMDLHSYAADILYAWGDDDPHTTDPDMNFVNPEYDGKRGLTGGPDPEGFEYMEYFRADDLETEVNGTSKMVQAMNGAGAVEYDAYPAVGLYPTSGASNDYAMGRYYGKLRCDASRMFGYTLEFGAGSESFPDCPFYTNETEFHDNVRQVGAGFMEMMLQAAGPAGDPLYPEC
jgi:hypothetical protein